jgi:hypothetical protein
LDVLRVINIFTQAFFVGSMNWVLISTIPAMRRMTERETVRTHQTQFDDLPDRFLPALAVTSTITAFLILFIADLPTSSIVLYSIGLGAMLVVGLVSVLINVPINRKIRHWSPDAIPEEYPRIRRRWNRVHMLRVFLAGVALVCYIIAALAAT